jgi:hypothetical protein
MAINVVKHIRKLVQRRDRLANYISKRQKELDAVVKELERVESAVTGGKPRQPTDPPIADGTLTGAGTDNARALQAVLDARERYFGSDGHQHYLCATCGRQWVAAKTDTPICPDPECVPPARMAVTQ